MTSIVTINITAVMGEANQYFKRGIKVQAGRELEGPIRRYGNIERCRRYRLENRSDRGSLLGLSPYHSNLAGI
jgi:hypothetical protein